MRSARKEGLIISGSACSRSLLYQLGNVPPNLEFQDDVLILRIFRGKRAVSDSLGDHKQFARPQGYIAQLRFPTDAPLVAEDHLVAFHIAMPKGHRLLGSLGKVDSHSLRLEDRQRCALGFGIVRGAQSRIVDVYFLEANLLA